MAYDSALDIANRCLTHLGRPHITSFSDQSEEAHETGRAYEPVRLDELNSSLWKFATRRAAIRPIGVDSLLWTPPTYAASTAYTAGQIVAYTPSASSVYQGQTLYWQTDAASTGVAPDAGSNWRRWFGSEAVDLYNSDETGYHAGEIVIVPAAYSGATSYSKNEVVRSSTTWYVSLVDTNLGNAVTDTTKWAVWDAGKRSKTTWGMTSGGTDVPLTYPGCGFYISLVSGNADNPLATGARWLSLAGTGAALRLLYPIGGTVYRVPYGYQRMTPQDPKAYLRNSLGVPDGETPRDWVLEGRYLVTGESGPIVLRFVADVIDVTDMDTNFCEMLAARMAVDLAPRFEAGNRVRDIERVYRRALLRAKGRNAVEIGPVSPVLDTLITCRL